MFSTKSEYGVRVMVQLARRRGAGPVPLAGDRPGRERCRSPTSSSWCPACARPTSCPPPAAPTAAMSFRATRPRSRWPRSCTRSRSPCPDAVLERARRHAACSATTSSTGSRTAPRSCCGPGSRAASRGCSSRRPSPSWQSFAEHGPAGRSAFRAAHSGATPRTRRPRRPHRPPRRTQEKRTVPNG